MKYIQRKTNVRQHERHNKHKIANVKHHQRNLKTKRQLGVIALNNLTYKQAKKTFPGLKPYGDIDRDGVINKRDCRPFDTDRQDDAEDLINEAEADERERLMEEIKERRPFETFQSGEDSEDLQRELEAVKREDEEMAEQQRIRDWGISQNKENRERGWFV